ncbi:cytochrome c peroxidase [Paracoccus sp. (in: a-proteobacteria)]|uniref:cytochrome-c peroxidase n=1 Tax=Paracoccus sp. TaxID=267 RepID=UPI00289F8F17|nr:cytochrome c peroxidase [Paracoccus sp. (in: a-proteobacteria)]
MLTRLRLAGLSAVGVTVLTAIAGFAAVEHGQPPAKPSLEILGEALFSDPSLSRNGTQSCATCHDPDRAFTDPREGRAGMAVSVGDDGQSHGDRNTPTLGYMAMSPDFHFWKEKGEYKGGQFWDGRAKDLADQAGQPMLNPVEMAMPDKATVVERLRANPDYVAGFTALYGADALSDVDAAFSYVSKALAAYQSTPEFSPFDSKFDRFLRGEEKLSTQEEFGYAVYLTWNCRLCHQLRAQGVTERESFSNFEYRNIGIPVNHEARAASGLGADFVDLGLAGQAGVNDPAQAGKFKVPTLRNVAVTGPYMHNGVFNDLRTAVVFYNKYTTTAAKWQINPETGEPWGDPEVPENLAMKELRSGLTVSDARVDALVAFLETLTDKRYEPLLEEQRAARAAATAKGGD